MSETYSIRITRHWAYRVDGPPELIVIHDVWRGEEWKSGHKTRAEAEKKIALLLEYGPYGPEMSDCVPF